MKKIVLLSLAFLCVTKISAAETVSVTCNYNGSGYRTTTADDGTVTKENFSSCNKITQEVSGNKTSEEITTTENGVKTTSTYTNCSEQGCTSISQKVTGNTTTYYSCNDTSCSPNKVDVRSNGNAFVTHPFGNAQTYSSGPVTSDDYQIASYTYSDTSGWELAHITTFVGYYDNIDTYEQQTRKYNCTNNECSMYMYETYNADSGTYNHCRRSCSSDSTFKMDALNTNAPSFAPETVSLRVFCPSNCGTCGSDGACMVCDDGYLTSGGECMPASDCKNGLHVNGLSCEANTVANCNTEANGKCSECINGTLEQDGKCVSSCGSGYKDMGGFCNRVLYTPAEAAAVLNDDNTNVVTITFKK